MRSLIFLIIINSLCFANSVTVNIAGSSKPFVFQDTRLMDGLGHEQVMQDPLVELASYGLVFGGPEIDFQTEHLSYFEPLLRYLYGKQIKSCIQKGHSKFLEGNLLFRNLELLIVYCSCYAFADEWNNFELASFGHVVKASPTGIHEDFMSPIKCFEDMSDYRIDDFARFCAKDPNGFELENDIVNNNSTSLKSSTTDNVACPSNTNKEGNRCLDSNNCDVLTEEWDEENNICAQKCGNLHKSVYGRCLPYETPCEIFDQHENFINREIGYIEDSPDQTLIRETISECSKSDMNLIYLQGLKREKQKLSILKQECIQKFRQNPDSANQLFSDYQKKLFNKYGMSGLTDKAKRALINEINPSCNVKVDCEKSTSGFAHMVDPECLDKPKCPEGQRPFYDFSNGQDIQCVDEATCKKCDEASMQLYDSFNLPKPVIPTSGMMGGFGMSPVDLVNRKPTGTCSASMVADAIQRVFQRRQADISEASYLCLQNLNSSYCEGLSTSFDQSEINSQLQLLGCNP